MARKNANQKNITIIILAVAILSITIVSGFQIVPQLSRSVNGFWVSNGQGDIYNTNQNDVGIGTSNPTSKLTVNGKSHFFDGVTIGSPGADTMLGVESEILIGSPPGAASPRIAFLDQDENFLWDISSGSDGTTSVLNIENFNYATGIWKPLLHMEDTGNVGIGTFDPRSTLDIPSGYIQLPVIRGSPPSSDCDQDSEVGRMVIQRDSSGNLYICVGEIGSIGWKSV